jgi:hypothetical protein
MEQVVVSKELKIEIIRGIIRRTGEILIIFLR